MSKCSTLKQVWIINSQIKGEKTNAMYNNVSTNDL